MSNLELWEKVSAVPAEAQKTIAGGRLRGKTDINPMWRIKILTEMFGMCGVGWFTKVTNRWLENASTGEKKAFVEIELYVKNGDEWSAPIYGIGGNTFEEKESNGIYVNDECYKMAYTDALSVACKALGIGADVYWADGKTKYTPKITDWQQEFWKIANGKKWNKEDILKKVPEVVKISTKEQMIACGEKYKKLIEGEM